MSSPPIVGSLPTPPNRGMAPDVFASAADAFVAAMPTFGADANALAVWINATAQSVNADKSASASNASSAADSAAAAAASKSDAQAAALAAQSAAGLPPLPDAGQLLKTEGVPLIATASANLVVNRAYEVDSAAGALTLTLPSAPVPGAYVWLTDVGGCVSRNNVTVTRNGSLINGVAEDFVMDVDRRNHLLVFINATYGWIIK